MQVESLKTRIPSSDLPESKNSGNHPLIATDLANIKYLLGIKEYGYAFQKLVEVLAYQPKNLLALNWMYLIFEKQNRSVEGLLLAKNILKIDYGFESIFRLAQCYYIAGEDQKALDQYFEALSVLGHETKLLFEIYKNIGNIYVRFKDYEAAQEYYDKANTVQPNSDTLYVNYGTLEVQRGNFDQALQYFREGVKINSANSKAWVGIAMIHDLCADHELAWANIIQAFEYNPMNKTALNLIYQWAIRENKVNYAIKKLIEFLSVNNEDEEASLWLADLYRYQGEKEWAYLELHKILLFNPNHQEAKIRMKEIEECTHSRKEVLSCELVK